MATSKYTANRNGRVRWLARLFDVKLPAWRGRRPQLDTGDVDGFVAKAVAHRNENKFRHAMAATLVHFNEHRETLTTEQRRELLAAAAKVLGFSCEQPTPRRRKTHGPRVMRRRVNRRAIH